MRIAFIHLGAFLGFVVACTVGPPRGYWNDASTQQIVAWVLWTFGCVSAGALAGLLIHVAVSKGVRPRFSLRTMFVLTTVLCLWLGYRLSWIRERREAREWITAHRGIWTPTAEYQGIRLVPDITPVPPLGLRWLGEEGVCYIHVGHATFQDVFIRDDMIAEMKMLFPEAFVDGVDNVIQRPAKP